MNAPKPTTSNTPPSRGQAGSLAVEMALVLPILVMLVLGVLEIANIFRIQTTLQGAAAKIAHDAAMSETTEADAKQFMDDNKLVPMVQQTRDNGQKADPPKLDLTPKTTVSCKETPCDPFEVKLTYVYYAMTEPMKPFFDNLTLTASAKKMSENW